MWTIGKDLQLDPSGNTALSNHLFVRKGAGASDSNDGSINSPFLTIQHGLNQLSSGWTLVIGAGVYQEYLSTPNNLNGISIVGDGHVVLRGDGATSTYAIQFNGDNNSIRNIIFNNYINNYGSGYHKKGNDVIDCMFIGGATYFQFSEASGSYCFATRNTFYNSQVTLGQSTLHSANLNKFINCSVNITKVNYNSADKNNYDNLFYNSDIIFTANTAALSKNNCFYNSKIIVDSTEYDDLDAAKAANNAWFQDCIDADPQFAGNIEHYEYIVAPSSPLLRAGSMGQHIGDVKEGYLINQQTNGWGSAAEVAGDTDFENGTLKLTNGSMESTRYSDVIELPYVFKSPFLRLNGIPDYVSNVVDSNDALTNFNNLTVLVQWAGLNNVFNGTWKHFLLNERMYVDETGKSNGEVGYSETSKREIIVKFIKIGTTLRNNRTEQ